MSFSVSIFTLTVLAIVSRCAAQCVLTVPQDPLTAQGLASPYKMTGCNQINFSDEGCFVEAAILDPATGDISIYNPLVINQDQAVAGVDFIPPVVPTLPPNAVVGIWFGSNAMTLTLAGTTNGCVNGDGNSIFGQYAYCNAPAFFTAAETAVAAGLLQIPAPGSTTKAATVQPCPVTRDFRIIDMDQSDNVDTTYLLINGTVLAQNTADNAAANKNSTEFGNGSDNALLNVFLAPTLGCTSFTAPSITSPNGISSSMALNELQSQLYPPAGGPALIPLNDDFSVISAANGDVTQSLAKTNLYRAGVGQPQANDLANASATTYCTRYAESGLFIAMNQDLFTGAASPAPGASSNLFTFLANRFATSFGPVPSLGCVDIFGLNDSPVDQTTDGNGVVTAATINTQVLQNIVDGVIKPAGATSSTSSITSSTVAGNLSTTANLVVSTTAGNLSTTANLVASTTAGSLSTTANLVASTLPGNLSTIAQLGSSAKAGSTWTSVPVIPTTTLAVSAIVSTTPTTTAPTTAAPTSAPAPVTTVVATTTVVQVVTFFEFILSLGGLPPPVTANEEFAFVVLEELFADLASAASAACNHQFNRCAGIPGAAFDNAKCSTQMDRCQGVASTASPTASTPTTLTATATVPTTVVTTPSPTATSASAPAVDHAAGAGAGADAGAGSVTSAAAPAAPLTSAAATAPWSSPAANSIADADATATTASSPSSPANVNAGAGAGSCPAAVTSTTTSTTISISISMVTVTVTAPAGNAANSSWPAVPTLKKRGIGKITHW